MAGWLLVCTARAVRPGGWPACDVAVLRDALDGLGASTTVAVVPADVPPTAVARLVRAGEVALASGPVAATVTPVVEAVKQVDGRRLVATVDRATLRHVTGPVVTSVELLRHVLDEASGPTVRPVHALVGAAGAVVEIDASVAGLADREEARRG